MTSRRLIRIKVLQLLYSYTKKAGMTQAEAERDLLKSIEKSTDLYYEILLLLTEIQHKAFLKIDIAKNKHFASETDLHPNTRFVENPVLLHIQNNKKFRNYLLNHPVSWNNNQEFINFSYNALIGWLPYSQYMAKNAITFEDHKQIILDFFTEVITQQDDFFQVIEDKNIYWNDDTELILGLVYKTLKNIQVDCREDDSIFIPVYNEEEDIDFAKTILRKTILDYEDNLKVIDKFTFNWELERISDIDKLIMACAISELKYSSSIPIKVTLDEYIEISKSYSSPKSSGFINGVLDKAITLLKEEGLINKSGRGLME